MSCVCGYVYARARGCAVCGYMCTQYVLVLVLVLVHVLVHVHVHVQCMCITSSSELQIDTPSEPAPSTGLTTALNGVGLGSLRNCSTSSILFASACPHAFNPALRTASVCRNLLRRRGECSVPFVLTPSASLSSSPNSTPVSQPTMTSSTRTGSARTAAAVAAILPASCSMRPAYCTSKPLATNAFSSSGITSDQTATTWSPRLVTS